MKSIFSMIAVILFFTLSQCAIAAPLFDGVVVFGDSLSDNGNLFRLKKGQILTPPYYQGRCSNGPVWVEYLTEKLGLPLSGLNDLAIAGAETSGQHPEGMTTQVSLYVKTHPVLDQHSVYIIWAGANNYLKHPYTGSYRVKHTINDIQTAIKMLAQHGAQYILIPNLPDLGTTPLANNMQRKRPYLHIQHQLTKATLAHNLALAKTITDLQKKWEKTPIVLLSMDDAGMVKEAEEYPKRFGLININQACYQGKALFHGGGTVCAEPDKYLFWDIVHPTTVGHAALADLALQTIRNTTQ